MYEPLYNRHSDSEALLVYLPGQISVAFWVVLIPERVDTVSFELATHQYNTYLHCGVCGLGTVRAKDVSRARYRI